MTIEEFERTHNEFGHYLEFRHVDNVIYSNVWTLKVINTKYEGFHITLIREGNGSKKKWNKKFLTWKALRRWANKMVQPKVRWIVKKYDLYPES